MEAQQQLLRLTEKTLELSEQPAVLLTAQLDYQSVNAAFMDVLHSKLPFSDLIVSEERDDFIARLGDQGDSPKEYLLTLSKTKTGEMVYSRWKFQFQEEINCYVGFGELYDNDRASISEVAELLKSPPHEITDFTRHLTSNIDKFQLISDHISDVVCLHHPEDARYLYVSPSVKSLLGYTPEELEGRTPYEFFHPDFIKFLESDHQRSASGESEGPPPEMDVMLITQSGEKIWASVHSEPVFDENGNVALIISSTRDITARKQLEEDLQKKNTELNAFSYRISHDLRSPLTTIMGLIDMINSEHKVAKVGDYSAMISDRINAMDQLLQSIMGYAKNMNNEVAIETTDLPDLVQDLISHYSYHANYEALSIQIEFNGIDLIKLDKERLSLILNCLLSNAFNFVDHDKDKQTLLLAFKRSTENFTIEVVDNGIGISEKVRPHVFDMFYRGTSQSQGAGLGLYLLNQAVEKLSGDITLTSQDKIGTTVKVTIPLSENPF